MDSNFYSYDAFMEQRLNDFINAGEHESKYHAIFATSSNKINDGPKEEPIGVRFKLPPFKGWGDL